MSGSAAPGAGFSGSQFSGSPLSGGQFSGGQLPVPGSSGQIAKKDSGSLVPALKPAAITVGVFAGLMVILQIVNSLTNNYLTLNFGIRPRSLDGLLGVVLAPLLHLDWQHLASNIVPFIIFGFLIMVGGPRQFIAVTVLVWLVGGLGVWLTADSNSVTIGASILVFGWLAYLVLRGFFTWNWGQIAIGVVLLAIWGSIFWTGIVSAAFNPAPVSWQGHLFGALGGGLAAFLVAKADGPKKKAVAA